MKKIKFNFSRYIADDRRQIANLLINAMDSLIESDEDINDVLREISEYYENAMGYFPVIELSKDDIRDAGFNPDNLTDNDMRTFADHMPKDSMMESYWVALKDNAKSDFKLPELHTEIDGLYEEYKKEKGKEPLYAAIWLEDRGYNNLPWQDTVKLTLDVGETDEKAIYMYFQGYTDMRNWLYSTLGEGSRSEDIWCYENPQQRIVFLDKLLLDE